jgi:hypothetical protein
MFLFLNGFSMYRQDNALKKNVAIIRLNVCVDDIDEK